MDLPKIKAFLESSNQSNFRYRQICKNYFSGRYSSFSQMTDLSNALRQDLDSQFQLLSVSPIKTLSDKFATKTLLKLADGSLIETVLMDYQKWQTACISTQVGCPLGCTFCATGKMGLKRNLSVEEIVDQVIYWKSKAKNGLRLVFMGMGEPFLNYENLISALTLINSKDGLEIGQRKISISTAGIAPKIIEFAKLDTEYNLAISLHSAVQSTRAQMMPIARTYELPELITALNFYTKTTNRQIFFEYLLAKNINDDQLHLETLIDLMRSNHLFYLNLIPLNPVKGGLTPSSRLRDWESILTKRGVNFSIRHSIGQSINSACGQLIVEK